MEKLSLSISGMSCGHCVSRVTKALQSLDGVAVEGVMVGTATLSYDPERVTPQGIRGAVDDLGFLARTS
jgi:copper chaperone